ncbi:hypothetical protein HF086_000738 [Spodoptera exigua]|uniref:DUF5641 domain-containing protein n=1 Tax=Spodoptera exigua TaxID=7107 RepID=A0A922M4U3_SPOEX|nr:hypothetical protein HF086_000738 [Spodoptera exigua]
MEGAIETQYQIMQAMNNVLTNFKKDGPSRKTPTNIKKKIDLLDKYWAEFQNNHEKISERENLTHPYFAQDSYEQTKEFYNSTRDYLVKYLNLDQKPVSPMLKSSAWTYDPTPSTSHKAESEPIQEQGDDGKGTTPLTIQVPEVPEPETNSKVSEMLRKQRSNIKAFQRNASNINLDVLKDKWQFEDALQVLELRWKAVDTLYWELDSLPNNTDIQYEMVQTSLITERAAQLLKLPRSRCKGVIFGVGATENNCKGSITITCSAIHNDYTFDTNVFIMRNLVNKLPNKSFKKPESWTFLENISLADPEFYVSRPVDILLGAEIYSNIIQEGIIRQDNSLPVAQQTRLGWILCGNVQTFHCNVVINNTDDIQKFWLIEDIAENSTMSQDDLDAVQYYKETTTRNKDGRYIVKIPFQTNFQERLGESKSMASAQFRSLEKKFSKQPQLAETYTNFIQESGGFNLRKWSSNNEELLQDVSNACSNQSSFDFKHAESTKTLGLKWHPREDTFSFELKLNEPKPTEKDTKRSLLSDISKIFDPLGWLSPITIKLKLLFKRVWLSNIQWDEQLPDEIIIEWEKIRSELHDIDQFRIQRWYHIGEHDTIQLHGFCDASIKAYACVVYCKIRNNITVVAAKTRLVPDNKKLTLPRLELSGAQLLATLINKIQQALPEREIRIFGWSDSTAVLGWIQGGINRWTPFVANRVKQITKTITSDKWYYVKSADNPADCASRGITVEGLKQHQLWWSGPQFLHELDESSLKSNQVYFTNEEEKKTKQTNVTTLNAPHCDDIIQSILHIWSRWQAEYLAQLSARSKWLVPHENVKVGDVVIIHEPNLPAGRWLLGRVIETHRGCDGLTRVVTLKTKNGNIKRPVIKVSVLVSESKTTHLPAHSDKRTDKQDFESKKPRSNRPGLRSHLITTITALFFFITTAFSQDQSILPHTLTKINTALYFDKISNMQFIRDEWKLIVYYDMNPYWEG